MKTVRLEENIVREVIPDYALPVAQWYGEEFATQCMEAPDEVDQHWTYDPEAGAFSPPVYEDPDPEPAPTGDVETRVTALEEAIAAGLSLYEEDLGNG